MKNQYFGDVRDLFKYDLLQRILKETSCSQRLTFIPMLTKYDPESSAGNKRDFDRAKKDGRPGTNNKRLVEFLTKRKEIDRDKRDFTEIVEYFKSESIRVVIYKGHEYFDNMSSEEYFKNIPEELLHKSLVFVDPDIGLQIQKSTEKHLLYREVTDLHYRMDEDSILMIYQHFPQARDKHKEYLPPGRSNKLKQVTGDFPIWITDNEIMFFLLTKNDELKSQLEGMISRYKRDYQERIETGNVN